MKNKGRSFLSDDAVSEVVDFSITLGLMLLAIGIIGVAGYPMVEHMKEMGHTENIRQSFSVLTPNINKIVAGKTPSQSVELKMHGGTVSITGDSYMNVTVDIWNESTSSMERVSHERQLRMIKNEYKGTTIAYENTGAWAQYPAGRAVEVSKPVFAYDNSSMIIPMVTITGSKAISGAGLIRVVSDGGHLSVESYRNVSRVEITLSSDYYHAWESYLSESLEMQIIDVNTSTRTVFAGKDHNPQIEVFITVSPMSVSVE
ncbi:MAG: hypothetical protein QCH31_07440 [Methanolobus sp.]|nr:hypothetical protein [Methanolobus sp.]